MSKRERGSGSVERGLRRSVDAGQIKRYRKQRKYERTRERERDIKRDR